ncbi:MAG TPA: hypothetical protein VKG78_05535 [Opitutaceae bacterium]|nr:hypothetical protein [Opitutaceae bacterium]
MTARPRPGALDRYTNIGELSDKVRAATKRMVAPLFGLLAIETAYLGYTGRPGAAAFALMGAGACAALAVWCRRAIGLPLLPVMIIQSLIIYGVPIAAGHEVIRAYPQGFVFSAGVEVAVFEFAMAAAWWLGMQVFRPAPPWSYALHEFNRAGAKGWARLGFAMVIGATAFQVLQGLDLLGALYAAIPSGGETILYALVSVVSACGFFLVALVIGGKEASFAERALFWLLLVANAMMSASDFILSSAAANLITVAIGFFWSSERMPWRYLTVAMLALSFLNTGKSTMRSRYWGTEDAPVAHRTFRQLPACYEEWARVSFSAIVENDADKGQASGGNQPQAKKNQTLLDRIDNLQNLLFAIDAIETNHIKPLHGQTYTLIPPLLLPRVLWPDKPRTHEGQILLNVHFGRQDLESTYTTYVAWGLLPEAYGNFGPLAGSIYLGIFLGGLFAWIENLTARKLLVSMEGFVSLSVLMNLMNSFEMVASVLVTSTFQSCVVVIAASLPFVHRTKALRPPPDGS